MVKFEGEYNKSIAVMKRVLSFIALPIYMKGETVTRSQILLNRCYFIALATFQFIVILCYFGYVIAAGTFNFLDVTECLPCSCFCIAQIVKLFSLRLKLKEVGVLVNELDRLYPVDEENEEAIEIIKSDTRRIRISVLFIALLNFCFVWNWNVSSLMSMGIEYIRYGTVTKWLPFYVWLPFETETMYKYVIAYFIHIAMGHFAGVGAAGPDVFFIAMVNHLVLQFKLLQIKIRNAVDKTLPENYHENLDIRHNYHEEIYQKLVSYVKIHKELIELTETVEGIFTLSILINFLCSTVVICCTGFQMTVITGIRGVTFVTFLIVGTTQTLFVCDAGQRMIDESCAIGDAIYNSQWYLTDKKFRQMALIIITRAQRPQAFTALRFSVVCFRSFASIMSSSYSYFTLINTSYQK